MSRVTPIELTLTTCGYEDIQPKEPVIEYLIDNLQDQDLTVPLSNISQMMESNNTLCPIHTYNLTLYQNDTIFTNESNIYNLVNYSVSNTTHPIYNSSIYLNDSIRFVT